MTDVTEFEDAETLEGLHRINERLQRQLRDAKDRGQRMVDAAHQGAHDAFLSLGQLAPIPPPPKDRRRKRETALWMLTDWQGAKRESRGCWKTIAPATTSK